MLRITTDKNPRAVTLRLEGRLEGPWVALLAQCWDGEQDELNGRRLHVDLNGVTFIDSDGKTRLARMHEQGAQFVTDDVMTKAIVAEIVANNQPKHHERQGGPRKAS